MLSGGGEGVVRIKLRTDTWQVSGPTGRRVSVLTEACFECRPGPEQPAGLWSRLMNRAGPPPKRVKTSIKQVSRLVNEIDECIGEGVLRMAGWP